MTSDSFTYISDGTRIDQTKLLPEMTVMTVC